MTQDILYKVIIYKEVLKIEIYKNENKIIDKYCSTEAEIYKIIVCNTHDCKDINQIEIIYK